MKLQLTRPLVFFDLETTGVNIAADRIVEISLVKQYPDGNKEGITRRVNPEMHIPEAASQVHHIYDEDVASMPTFRELMPEVLAFIEGCDLAGYNSNHFDVPMLQEELMRAGSDVDLRADHHFVDVFVIFQKHTPRNLTAAYKHYCGKDLEGAHGANADTEATREVLLAQLEKHADVPNTVEALEEYTTMQHMADFAGRIVYDSQHNELLNFGKYKGQSLAAVFTRDPSYYSWIMDGDFPLYTKRICRQVMERMKKETGGKVKHHKPSINKGTRAQANTPEWVTKPGELQF
ncbi:MAG: 3'-5' exonuclease [Paludibacteraceae bacterium]|nr:3'-5' exonuclease [Paludibacteraceae bacterium]